MPARAPKPTWSSNATPEEIMREVRKAFEDFAQEVPGFNVGAVYVQYPGQDAPATIFGGRWLNITSLYAGLFFRAEGGDALAFGEGAQLDAFQAHGHRLFFDVTSGTSFSGGNDRVATNSATPVSSTLMAINNVATTVISTTAGTPRTASETRPVNQSIRIWKRSA